MKNIPSSPAVKHLPLHNLHVAAGARMVEFAGWHMPVQYPAGIKQEHLHCRTQAALFDVSHMGQLRLNGKRVDRALEHLTPADIVDLPLNQQRYALLTSAEGGILDDCMVSRYTDYLYMVVNAARREHDIAYLKANLGEDIAVEEIHDRALLALQGPLAATVLARLQPEVQHMRFMASHAIEINGAQCYVSRSGYTGEDGFEISIPIAAATQFAEQLLVQEEVAWAGLGARDALRLEAGLCLYGHDIDTHTTPVEAGLSWSIGKARRPGAAREGGFPGEQHILGELVNKSAARKRVGLVVQGRAPVREGAALYDQNNNRVGHVTSGLFSPTLEHPIAMAYVQTHVAKAQTYLLAEVRGKQLPVTVVSLPFVPHHYHR
ncbi:glycine cleavage system aminomethyltransferase GcvT [Pusillimonas sp. DMV24BSW_D]|uniref:glycine cleavage system aminomethyltransferase GcvT n=1 Tax=Neopusillimonas aestuarii TaxID=2716226 RepID=UPI00140B2638|nr:glycine cleavage system aminomethyltransferase GcvT [Pusillimonas sp. DMV24BSW_D]QIM47716.1 glycine cleavage system aminomethyltransferase GcvT [Pusillimonas sp. DMV24BSW_D]